MSESRPARGVETAVRTHEAVRRLVRGVFLARMAIRRCVLREGLPPSRRWRSGLPSDRLVDVMGTKMTVFRISAGGGGTPVAAVHA